MKDNDILDRKQLAGKKTYFLPVTWTYLSNGMNAYEQADYLSASIFFAVFTESVLKDIVREGNLSNVKTDQELGGITMSLKRYVLESNAPESKGNLSKKDLTVLQNINNLANEVRLKRNRLVHDTGMAKSKLKAAADDLCANVCTIAEMYTNTSMGESVRARNIESERSAQQKHLEASFPVFLSTVTPRTFEHTEFIESLCSKLEAVGIKPVRCELTDFDSHRPMEKTCKCIEECHAVIILGLERSHAYYYKDNEGSLEEKENVHRHYSSSWLQLEAGMAIGMGKQLFVLCQKDLYSDGIFDRKWNSYTPLELEIPLSIEDPKINTLIQALTKYKDEYSKHSER